MVLTDLISQAWLIDFQPMRIKGYGGGEFKGCPLGERLTPWPSCPPLYQNYLENSRCFAGRSPEAG
jgi:hypothetical protein